MSTEEKIIMYDSPEAAQYRTGIEGWVSSDGRFFGKGGHAEQTARYAGSTHHKCECGGIAPKGWIRCDYCSKRIADETYLKLQYKEWDGKEPICLYDGEKYFWDESDLIDYLYDNELNGDDVQLVFCVPITYEHIDGETIASESHEEWEPSKELSDKINEFNKYLSSLPPHSWTTGKTRTSYEYTYVNEDE